MWERLFRLSQAQTTVKTEIISGVTTFMTLSYIIFVQPAVLSTTGMDFGAVMVATCLAGALATFLMGILANYPIALAPAMGHNFYFAFTVCGVAAAGGLGYSWQLALGAVFLSGSIFILFSFWGLREKIVNAVPEGLKNAIAVGIGLLIALIGMEWAGIVVATPGTIVGLGDLGSPPVLLSLFGLVVIFALITLRVRGALLIGIIATALVGFPFGLVKYQGLVSLPPSLSPVFFKLNVGGIFANLSGFITVIFVFFFLDLFDTIGTLIGVSEQAGFIRKGRLPRARQALFSDAVGTVAGALLGTSTITSYIESAAGIAEGGRTGLSNMVTGALMLLALFFYPFARMIGGGYEVTTGVRLYPVIAPALIVVGSMMLRQVKRIEWEDPTEALPAFLSLIVMPLTFSITEGIAFGFISYSFLKILTGQWKKVNWIIHLFALLFLLRYLFLKG
jgi:AGZA family xanthine/uracil permease-like MFS transporter